MIEGELMLLFTEKCPLFYVEVFVLSIKFGTKNVHIRVMENKYVKLVACLLLDALGYLSYFVLGIGESIDVIWAPVAAWLNYKMFKDQAGTGGALFTFIEEALPGTDFIPSFTITWIYAYFIHKDKKPKRL